MSKVKKIGENVFILVDEKIDILEETESGIAMPERDIRINCMSNSIDFDDSALWITESNSHSIDVSTVPANTKKLSIECKPEKFSSYLTSYKVNVRYGNVNIDCECSLCDINNDELEIGRSLFVITIMELSDDLYDIRCTGIFNINDTEKIYMAKYDDGFGTGYGICATNKDDVGVCNIFLLDVDISVPERINKYEVL